MLHQARQHNIKVPYDFEGVSVMGNINHLDAYRWADVLVTHLDFTHFTVLLGSDIGRPVVHIVHNHHEYSSIVGASRGVNVVYNSQWIADKLKYKWPSVVIPPTVDVDMFNVNENPWENEFVTMININRNKGGRILQKIAVMFPEQKFLAVKGSYDEQIVDQPENVTVIDNTPDILNVYRKTKILLMPSQYESWGMTATEAMCSGIPVVCCPTPGLKENCSYAGNYIDQRVQDNFDGGNTPDDTDNYNLDSLQVKLIRLINDKEFYAERSEAARQRSLEHEPLKRMKDYEDFLYQTQGYKLKSYI